MRARRDRFLSRLAGNLYGDQAIVASGHMPGVAGLQRLGEGGGQQPGAAPARDGVTDAELVDEFEALEARERGAV